MLILILISTVNCLVPFSNGYNHHGSFGDDELTVSIPWSTIVGKQQQVLGRRLGVFLGLPYAKPPVGELKFKRPLPLESVHEHNSYDATSFRAPCVQSPSYKRFNNTNENCLFLNIWTPVIDFPLSPFTSNHVDPPSLKPVIFYIYGGGFDRGSVHEESHHGDVLSSLSDTLVVTVNHRLHILGFGYGATESMPGNMGIYDLIKALEWVNQNIQYFGGDPQSVTLFGACSGAMAASAFMLSPIVDKKLFSKVYLASSAVRPHSAKLIFNLTRASAQVVGCDNTNDPEANQLTEQQINCLRTVDSQTLINASFTDTVEDFLPWKVFPPFIQFHGTDFLPDPPNYLSFDRLPPRRIPILFGNEEAEDELMIANWPATKQEAKDLIESLMTKSYPNTNLRQLDSVFHYYFNDVVENDLLGIKQALTSAIGDYLHHCPLLLFTESWTRNGQLTFGYINTYVMDGSNKTERLFGTKHGDTAFQLLGRAFRDYDKFSDRDRKVSEKMIRILKDFAYGRTLPWPPMLMDSSQNVVPLKWKWTKTMDTKNIYSDSKDEICHLWGKIFHLI